MTPQPPTTPPPQPHLLIFILGAPCAGKSTLTSSLSTRHHLPSLTLSSDLRSLTSPSPRPELCNILPLFSAAELDVFRGSLAENTLAPPHLTARFVAARCFARFSPCGEMAPGIAAAPETAPETAAAMLIDGFPRDVQRWEAFRNLVGDLWRPVRGVVVVLDVEKRVARERFAERGRPGDVFERRFEEWEGVCGEVLEGMRRDGVVVLRGGGADGDEDGWKGVVRELGGVLERG